MSQYFTSSKSNSVPLKDVPNRSRSWFNFFTTLRSSSSSTEATQQKMPPFGRGLFRVFQKKTSSRPSVPRNKALHLEIHKQSFSAYRREIGHWQQARTLRYRSECPLTHALQEVYMDTMLDAHLSAVVSNRILRLQNKRYVVRDAKGRLQEEKTSWLERGWFQELVGHVVASVFYGYSLLWLKKVDAKSKQIQIELIDRRHVVPERKMILLHMQDDTDSLCYANWPHELLYAQLSDSYGLLEKATPLAILKRHSWANWDEFEQIFGLPIRIARVPNLDTHDTQRIAHWLEEMGTAAYAVLPESAQVEVKESRRSDAHEVFKEKIFAVNAEISKLVNGQTMTVDSGSSRSQSEVHLRTENEVTKADIRNLLRWLNDILLPALRIHGYAFDKDDRVDVCEEVSAMEKIIIDKELLRAGVRLSPEYISRTYGVSLEKNVG